MIIRMFRKDPVLAALGCLVLLPIVVFVGVVATWWVGNLAFSIIHAFSGSALVATVTTAITFALSFYGAVFVVAMRVVDGHWFWEGKQ